ncbi:hypothetical protein VPH35_042723 [Triticum aestivum]
MGDSSSIPVKKSRCSQGLHLEIQHLFCSSVPKLKAISRFHSNIPTNRALYQLSNLNYVVQMFLSKGCIFLLHIVEKLSLGFIYATPRRVVIVKSNTKMIHQICVGPCSVLLRSR